MPYRSNIERNAAIYKLWEEGKSIEEISLLTGIPRSTVGYYVHKFNVAARTGGAIPLPPPTKKQPTEILFGFLEKATAMDYLLTLLKTCDAQTIYYNLAATKLLGEQLGRFELTNEERKVLSSVMTGLWTRAPPQVTDQKRKGPSVTDIAEQLKQLQTRAAPEEVTDQKRTLDDIIEELKQQRQLKPRKD
jgi:hypothetical protein